MGDSKPLGAHPDTAIAVDDEDDLQTDKDRQVNIIQRARKIHAAQQPASRKSRKVKKEEVDAEDYEQSMLAEADLVKEIMYVDLTDDGPTRPPRARNASIPGAAPHAPAAAAQSPSIQLHNFELEMPRLALQSGVVVTKDSIVVLKEPLGRFRIQFLKVQVIIKNRLNGRVRVRGWPYTRARNLDGQLMRKLNEVCLVGHIDEEDPRPWLEQAIIDVYESDIEGLRVGGLRTTNAPFPQFRFGDAAYRLKGKRWVEHHEVLVCRYHHYLVYRDVIKKKLEKAHQWVLIHANEDMSDAEYKVRDMAKTNDWRGGNIPGGSFCPLGFDPEVISIDDDDDEDNKVTLDRNGSDATKADGPNMRKPGQKYTVGDLFSGAGGASRGIQQAGFKLVFAVDHWSVAVTTYRANFPEVDCHLMEVDDFTKDSDINYRVDILHLSPPCQVWSPAHTIAGQNDDKNMAALMSCTEVIEQIRPRLFTLEQTFGMLHTRFELYFNGLVGGFTDHGYSVRWGVINFNTWGLCQPRRRLVMVGACPGQALPDFPSATHSQDGAGGLLPFTTSREALAHLRAGDDLHDVADMPRLWNARSWDPDAPLPHTITCSGGQNHHWGGQRDFTAREYASLQGFPVRHRFRGAYLKRQIGNAFPPSMARRLFGHLRDFLEREDRMVGPREAEHEYVEGREVIDLDDDDDGGDNRRDKGAGIARPESGVEDRTSVKPEQTPKPRAGSKATELSSDSDESLQFVSQSRRRRSTRDHRRRPPPGRRSDNPIALDEDEDAPVPSPVPLAARNMKVQSPKPGVRTEESIPGPAQQNRLQSASPVAETAAVARQASDPIMDWQAHILSLDPRVQFANEGTPGGPSPAGHMPSQPPAPRTKMTDEDTSDPGPATPAPGRSVDPGAERVARENGAHSPAWEARAYSVGTAAEMAVQGSRASSAAHQERVQSVDEWVDMVVQEDGAAHTAPPTRQARANPVDLGVDIADEVSDSETVRGEELVSDSMEIDSGTR